MVLLALTMSMSFASCSDDDDPESNVNYLIGSWESTWEKGYEINTDSEGKEVRKDFDEASSGYFITFKENGTGYDYEEGFENDRDNFTWSLKGDKLYMKDMYEEEVITVKELSKNTLKIYDEEEEDGKVVYTNLSTYKKMSK